ncbi:zinc-binding dehydrogenase [Actinomadura sp. LD22]|uniref:Zinc-binding dehydrogenase n=1 Tax=Actinomadura physcomitrii TaxID=2650748 RepID=A0A6I4MHG8_9ACTN|nr:zinc-binding dehydrogenase [Actinomadura physcomitrii]MWA03594.1 zinc-binding dehydrogenase [Actinomadura physcomitrii]
MRALSATGDGGLVEPVRVPEPSAGAGEVLVDVRAVSVNRGELHRLTAAAAGWRPGWDFAGVVADQGTSGDAPAAGLPAPGTRVFGIADGGSWAERVAVPAARLAVVPDGLSLERAAALPTAGLTALRTLRMHGDLAGAGVLVTGAAGGVGRFAVQLARRCKAEVTAVVGRPDRGDGLAALGAAEVVVGVEGLEAEFDLVLETGGGESLREALRLVAPRGTVVSFGNSSRASTAFSVSDFYPKEASLRGFYVLNDLDGPRTAADLAYLAGLAATNELVVDIAATSDWRDARAVLCRLRDRRLAGKAVLLVTKEKQS